MDPPDIIFKRDREIIKIVNWKIVLCDNVIIFDNAQSYPILYQNLIVTRMGETEDKLLTIYLKKSSYVVKNQPS